MSDRSPTADIGWPRAILSGLAIVVVGFVGAVYLPSIIVTKLDGMTTTTRSLIAAAVTIGVVVVMAFALRRLQARRII